MDEGLVVRFAPSGDVGDVDNVEKIVESRLEFEEYLLREGADPEEVNQFLDTVQINTTNFYPVAAIEVEHGNRDDTDH